MKRTDQFYIERAAEILRRIEYGVVATVKPDGTPWASPVQIVRDRRLWFYWFSDKAGQHSVNVRANGRAAMVVLDSTVPEGQGAGVYLVGRVDELSDPSDIALAHRIKHGEPGDPGEFLGVAVRRVYRLTPMIAWTNDVERRDGQFIRDVRVPLEVTALRGALYGAWL